MENARKESVTVQYIEAWRIYVIISACARKSLPTEHFCRNIRKYLFLGKKVLSFTQGEVKNPRKVFL
jgi:hypothetical protein